jgi:hypothetical protein
VGEGLRMTSIGEYGLQGYLSTILIVIYFGTLL